ncbi:hypothetical protein [Vibrio agarilyticus]|nr:hypothetical protein [Vibrio agarilyticus]
MLLHQVMIIVLNLSVDATHHSKETAIVPKTSNTPLVIATES